MKQAPATVTLLAGGALLAGGWLLGGCALDGSAPASTPAPAAIPPGDAQARPAAVTPVETAGTCGADRLAGYVGAVPTTAVVAAIQQAIGAVRIRTIAPGDAVTLDYRADRLNLELGGDGRIARLRCY